MTAAALVEAFSGSDVDGLPPLLDLDDRGKAFWVLRVGRDAAGAETMSPNEISVVLRDAYGVDLSRQRVESILSAERGTVAKRRSGDRRVYQLMAEGDRELEAATEAAQFIDPERGYTGLRAVQELLGSVRGEMRLCDPYIETRTLDMAAECGDADPVRILSQNIKRPDGLKQALKAFEREHDTRVEVRRAQPGVLHDRYLIHDDGMLMFGTSLNGLGLKQSLVVALGEDVRAATLAAFEATWDSADEFWPADASGGS